MLDTRNLSYDIEPIFGKAHLASRHRERGLARERLDAVLKGGERGVIDDLDRDEERDAERNSEGRQCGTDCLCLEMAQTYKMKKIPQLLTPVYSRFSSTGAGAGGSTEL